MRIKTERLVLRPLTSEDEDSLYENAKDEEMSKYTTVPHPYTKQNARDFILDAKRKLRKGKDYEFGIEYEGKIVGMVSLMKVNEKNRCGELGYWVGKRYWRKGIGKECVVGMVKFGFDSLNLVRIYSRVFPENIASANLLKKVGFQYEGRSRKAVFRHGRHWDMDWFSILDDNKICY